MCFSRGMSPHIARWAARHLRQFSGKVQYPYQLLCEFQENLTVEISRKVVYFLLRGFQVKMVNFIKDFLTKIGSQMQRSRGLQKCPQAPRVVPKLATASL